MVHFNDLKGKVALVTGASSGIGAATAVTLADHGATVILAARRLAQLEEVANKIKAEGGEAVVQTCDVSDVDSMNAMMEKVLSDFDHVDILVNNAGIVDRTKIEDLTLERYQEVQDVNLRSAFVLTQAVVPGMKKAGGGKIVNVASLAGQTGGALDSPAYHSSKGGMITMTMSYAYHLAPFGINVNCVAPGLIETPMTAGRNTPDAIPLGRLGEAQDIANGIYFMASNLSDFVVGVTLEVNGGMWMH